MLISLLAMVPTACAARSFLNVSFSTNSPSSRVAITPVTFAVDVPVYPGNRIQLKLPGFKGFEAGPTDVLIYNNIIGGVDQNFVSAKIMPAGSSAGA